MENATTSMTFWGLYKDFYFHKNYLTKLKVLYAKSFLSNEVAER